ncbi:FAD dependent oxidoreductase [Patellaria atrata CBS 101060]|uniref:FAD dependent oxidoreductase n=1 Tax=Patellaria atrata CBS 101060 TaxID=1346257 RepID=A0A9P4S6N7_9PEZI|nr:FAD dependent oxidoreductase [Patellaria atrata CBS 101060]
MSSTRPRNIVIIGGGIIGSTTAYFLSHHPSYNPSRDSITILEASSIAGGASGKAGGLLALWAYPSCIVPLSFRLHRELADQHNGRERWGYREVAVGSIDLRVKKRSEARETNGDGVSLQKRSDDAVKKLQKAGVPEDLDWVDPEAVYGYEEMAGKGETAQVHPYLFTTSMAALAQEKGVKIIYGMATSINFSSSPQLNVESITYTPKPSTTSETLPATDVIVSAGPWTPQLLPRAPITALRAHSVTIRPSRPISAYALFTSIQLTTPRSTVLTAPEIYTRPNDEIYACGEGDRVVPLPPTTADVEVDLKRCEEIESTVRSVSEVLDRGEVLVRQACYLPNGGPWVGETGVRGVVLAAGHTCWGIQNAPGTGLCVSELVWEGKVKSANIKSLMPRGV